MKERKDNLVSAKPFALPPFVPVLAALLLCLSSCIGVKSDIVIKNDGSGTIALEYRMSRMLASLGQMDGNEGKPPLPVGKADFERTVARVPGLKMRSFSSKDDEKDNVVTVKLEFSNTAALLGFLDAGGHGATLVNEGGKQKLKLNFTAGEINNRDLGELFNTAAAGYAVALNFTLPREGTLAVLDGAGKNAPSIQGQVLELRGKQLSWTVPLAGLIAEKGRTLELVW